MTFILRKLSQQRCTSGLRFLLERARIVIRDTGWHNQFWYEDKFCQVFVSSEIGSQAMSIYVNGISICICGSYGDIIDLNEDALDALLKCYNM